MTKIFGKKEENVSYCRLLSLLDPVTRKRMEIPCRGINCTHIDCFDKNGFFRYNRRRLEWKCPICQKPIKDDQLVVDGFFVNVLAKVFSSCKFIQIDSNFFWYPLYNNIILDNYSIELDDSNEDHEGGKPDDKDLNQENSLANDSSASLRKQDNSKDFNSVHDSNKPTKNMQNSSLSSDVIENFFQEEQFNEANVVLSQPATCYQVYDSEEVRVEKINEEINIANQIEHF